MKKVVGLGACVLDTLISCGTYPKEDTKQKADGVFVTGGGPVANALVVMRKFGVAADIIGGFGNDSAGKYILQDFERCGVETKRATVVDGATSFTSYVLLAQDKASRTCVFDRGSVPDEPKNVQLDAIDGAQVLHLDGNYLGCALTAAKYAKEKGVTVSLDAGGLYDGIETLLPYVDILIPSAEFARGVTGKDTIVDAMACLYEKYSPKILVVTDGSNGGYYYENGKAVHYDSVKVQAVDTNGAGDTFHGAFVAAYCKGMDVKAACEFASKVAAFKCANKGLRDLAFETLI